MKRVADEIAVRLREIAAGDFTEFEEMALAVTGEAAWMILEEKLRY